MFQKIKEEKGFTLAELLVVVAIIGVLVAVSIPIFTAQLEKAREATDIANMRAAKAAAVTAYLTDGEPVWKVEGGKKTLATDVIYYDAVNGKLVNKKPTAYGKGTATNGGAVFEGYEADKATTDKVIKVEIDESEGKVNLEWIE